MNKNFIAILITVIMCFTVPFGAEAQGLPDKPDITAFSYTLKDSAGTFDTAITSGGSLEVNLTLNNNTSSSQPYNVSLQILNDGKKVSIKSAKGTLSLNEEKNICLSDGFSLTETDFSKYTAEVYVWSDMDSMQPISTYSVLGSDNNDIYAYKIDNSSLLYTSNNTSMSHYFAKTYSGIPKIVPIFRDLASTYTLSPAIEAVTSDSQHLNFKVLSQKGTLKDYFLEIYKVTDQNDPKNADLANITLPTAIYNGNYNEMGFLYPTFNKDVTEYDVYTYSSTSGNYRPLSGFALTPETVNPAATVVMSTAPDVTLADTSAVYTVTSADGTVTKDYKINYHAIGMTANSLSITGIKNGLDTTIGSYSLYDYRLGGSGTYPGAVQDCTTNMVIQDGIFATTRVIRPTRPIIEIDISQGPAMIEHGILNLTNIRNLGNKDSEYDSGTLSVYKINDSIYSVSGGLSAIDYDKTKDYFGDKMCSIGIGQLTSNRGDMYFINIDASYYNSLKSAGKTKMYLGFGGEATNGDTMALGAVFGSAGDGEGNSRFNYITE